LAIFLAFSISYSLSILSEKPLITFAVSVLTAAFLFWLFSQFLAFMRELYAQVGNSAFMGPLIGVSFILASVLTLAKVDFTQQTRKVFTFSGLAFLFLALSFIAGTIIISKGNPFSTPSIVGWRSFKFKGNAYLATETGRIVRYDSKVDSTKKMPRGLSDAFLDYSFSAGRIGFMRNSRTWRGANQAEACVANLDGAQETVLARFYGADSDFNGWTPEPNVLISPSGRQVAFAAVPPRQGRARSIPVLFWMDVDGTGRMSRRLDFYRKGYIELIAWLEKDNSMVLRMMETGIHESTERIVRLDLASGATRFLESSSKQLDFYWNYASTVAPNQEALLFTSRDPTANAGKLKILDLKTLGIKDVCETKPLLFYSLAWSADSDNFAFINAGSLWVYSRSKGELREVWRLPDKDRGMCFDWIGEDTRIALIDAKPNPIQPDIVILGQDFAVEKRMRIPKQFTPSKGYWRIWGLVQKLLLVSEEGGLWRLDLKTDEWKKVY